MSEGSEGRKVVVAGGSSGGRLATVHQVAAVIRVRGQDKAQAAVEALWQNGKAWGIRAELTDRDHAPEVRKQVAAGRANGALLVSATGLFIPRAVSEYDEASPAIDFAVVPIARDWVKSSGECGTDDCCQSSATSRPSTTPSRPSTRPSGSS